MKSHKKTLYLLRHAKASKSLDINDIDRPLTEKGYAEAYEIARKLSVEKMIPELIVSSPAVRAFSTALIFQRILIIPMQHPHIASELYEASTEDVLSTITSIDDKFSSIMLVGHNPSFSELSAEMDPGITHVPTAGVVAFDIKIDNWKQADHTKAEKKIFIFPH